MEIAVIGGTRGLGNWIANFLKKRVVMLPSPGEIVDWE